MSEWISTKKKLPADGEHGLCCMHRMDNPGNPKIVVPFTFLNSEFHPYADDENIEYDDYWVDPLYWPSHWMPLPPPAEGE